MSFFPKYTIAVSILIFLSCKSGKHTDQSLSVGDYHDLGVPDPEQVWNVEDVMLAIDVFAGMKWERPYALPRKGSKKSGALFKRHYNSYIYLKNGKTCTPTLCGRINTIKDDRP
jgi:hypothetical protein